MFAPTDEDFVEMTERTERVLLLCRYLEKYVYPSEDSLISLAGKLRIWQALKSRNLELLPFDNLFSEKELLPFYRKTIRKLIRRIHKACAGDDHAGNDHKFLRNLSAAKELAASGKELSQGLDVTGQAVYAFALLRQELKRRPSRIEIQKRAEQWRAAGGLQRVSDRHWNRVFAEIDELLRFG
jgi:hypothetical protein